MRATAALVMIVKDEAPGIVEALAYHLGVFGFQRAVVYDNGSSDGTATLVRTLKASYDIDLIDWPFSSDRSPSPQMLAYHHALRRLVGQVDWIAFLDADEAVHGTAGGNLRELLELNHTADQIALNWAIFGSSGHQSAPAALNLDAYTRRAPLDFHLNRHCKVLVRPDRVQNVLNPHACDVHGETVNANGQPICWDGTAGVLDRLPLCVPFRVNHYVTRSREDWRRRAIRGSMSGTRRQDQWDELNRNEERDVSAHHFYGYALMRELRRVWPSGAARLAGTGRRAHAAETATAPISYRCR